MYHFSGGQRAGIEYAQDSSASHKLHCVVQGTDLVVMFADVTKQKPGV